MFYLSYLFSVLFLVFFILIMMMMYCASSIYVKFLIILVYVSGVVVFILYISCMCWYQEQNFTKYYMIFLLFVIYFFDSGVYLKISDVGEHMWMYLFFSFLFNALVYSYSLNLFKISGSLRI